MDRSDLTVAGKGTRYTAIARHGTAANRQQEEMGFLDGWSRALDQLVDLATELRGKA